MSTHHLRHYILFVGFVISFAHSQAVAEPRVAIEFVVKAPREVPGRAFVYLSGSVPGLGSWDAAALMLTRRGDGKWVGKAELPQGAMVEYKATLGTWATVERDGHGRDVGNRKLVADKSKTVEFEVVEFAAPAPARPRSSRTGDIRLHEHFASKELGNERTLIVWLPPGYGEHLKARYPVLYMHDGQNVFDAATSFIGVEWQADEAAARLIRAKRIVPIIIVGIYNNAERMNEYTPTRDQSRGAGGRGGRYARFVVKEVKPFIDRTYRTRPEREHTAIAGSSLGGLISLYMANQYADTFGLCAALSPSLMWDDGALLKQIEAEPRAFEHSRVWFDMGTHEGRQIEWYGGATKWSRRLATALEKAGRKRDVDYRYVEVKDAEHNEAAWAARFDQVLIFLFGKSG